MYMVEKLNQAQIEQALNRVPGWKLSSGTLVRQFVFADFNQAFAVMTRVALYAEKVGHHPEWRNVYNQLDILLTTHDVGGLSELDFAMATTINQYAEEVLSPVS